MQERLFHLDKNYLLKEVQASMRKQLIADLVARSILSYQHLHNPLGLIDQTIDQIADYKPADSFPEFHMFYKKVAAIYRYQHGNNQLEILWDGRSHESYYEEQWSHFFISETSRMFLNATFLKIMLELTVFANSERNSEMLVYRLSGIIREHFNMQVYKRKGIVPLKIA